MTSASTLIDRAGAAARGVGGALLALALLNAGLFGWLSPPGAQTAAAPAAPAQAPEAAATAPAATTQASAAQPVAAGEPIFRASFGATPQETGWTPFSGDWSVADGRLVQRLTGKPDLGVGYAADFSGYRLRVTLRHLEGVGGGVLFNMPHADSVAGAQMVRYTDDGAGIFWGYFDEQGVFQGQGFAATAPAGQTDHTLEVVSGAATYGLALDGAGVVEGVELKSQRGGIGLICSQAAASFGDIAVDGLDSAPAAAPTAPAPTAAPLDGMRSVTGDWTQSGDTLIQRATEASDFTTATGVAAERYTLSVNIEFPKDAPDDVGGGVIFQMPGRDELAGAAMARFADGGRSIFWGRYDAGGAFQGAGSADLPAGDPARRALRLTVRATSFDLAVDGKLVAKDVPLEREGGAIGLISFRGPVRFQAFQLALGE